MTVYLLRDAWGKEVFAVFSSEQKARKWLETKAVQEWGWTPGEAGYATIEPWLVDDVM